MADGNAGGVLIIDRKDMEEKILPVFLTAAANYNKTVEYVSLEEAVKKARQQYQGIVFDPSPYLLSQSRKAALSNYKKLSRLIRAGIKNSSVVVMYESDPVDARYTEKWLARGVRAIAKPALPHKVFEEIYRPNGKAV